MTDYIPSQEVIKRVLKNENSEEYDVGYYMGVKSVPISTFLSVSMKYHECAKDILWEYISDKDVPEIQKRLEELEE